MDTIKFGSVCSGIEAASVAFAPLGWHAAWLSEIEPFPSAALAHHYPSIPNLGDMTKIPARVLAGEVVAPDVLCGGTPCQSFSVAGMRQSLDDERGNLTLKFVELANAIDHVRRASGKPETIVLWENVPGVLSTKDNAFGCFLAGLAGEDEPLQPPGGKWSNAGCVLGPKRAIAWRTLDAQYFGVAQRRRRVFVVASARNGFDPAQVLFEWDSMRRDTSPRREARQVASAIPTRSSGGSGFGTDFDCNGGLIQAFGGNLQPGDPCHPLMAGGHVPAIAFDSRQDPVSSEHVFGALGSSSPQAQAVAVALRGREGGGTAELGDEVQNCLRASGGGGDKPHVLVSMAFQPGNLARGAGSSPNKRVFPTLKSDHGRGLSDQQPHVMLGSQVRRLTPTECERLQGFPDGYTRIPNWNGWRDLDHGELPEDLRTEGLQVKQSKKTGKWRVNDPDGPRYKALGNSLAVPVPRWIARRIQIQLARI